MSTIFTKIVKREIPAHIIAENERFLAFLDVNPLKKGHTLVIPKQETDYFFDLPEDQLGDIMIFAKDVARRLKIAFPCEKIAVSVIGLEVPHAHIHLIPMDRMSDVNFANTKLKISPEEMEEIADRINAIS